VRRKHSLNTMIPLLFIPDPLTSSTEKGSKGKVYWYAY